MTSKDFRVTMKYSNEKESEREFRQTSTAYTNKVNTKYIPCNSVMSERGITRLYLEREYYKHDNQ